MFDLRACLTIAAIITLVIELRVKFNQRLNRHAVNLVRRGIETNDGAAADYFRAKRLDQLRGFFNRVSAANDVINNDAWVHFALVHVLAEHSFPVFAFGPVDLLGAEGIADLTSYSQNPGQTEFFPDFFVDPGRI